MKREDITPTIVRELLDYDPETGVLTWKERDRPWFKTERAWKAWNTRFAEKPALTSKSHGYLMGRFLYHGLFAHRAAWMHYYGAVDCDHIDHVDGDVTNNRISNLRAATPSENGGNSTRSKNNKSGFKGVSWVKSQGKWSAYIKHNRKRIHLGRFYHLEDAARAYDRAALQHFGEFARLNFPEELAT